jgi:hypothetical protein
LFFDGSTFEIVGQVMLPVKELAADTGIGQDAFIPIALQGAFGDVQYPADISTVYIPVRGLRIEPAAYLRGKGGQLFQLVEKMRSCLLPDAYYLFHRFMIFRFNNRFVYVCDRVVFTHRGFGAPGFSS